MMLVQEEVDEIVRRVLGQVQAERIILFGSAASGTMGRDSDIDLLIIKEAWEAPRSDRTRIRRALRGMDCPFDIAVMSSAYFEETKNLIGGLAFPADKYGKVIYEAE